MKIWSIFRIPHSFWIKLQIDVANKWYDIFFLCECTKFSIWFSKCKNCKQCVDSMKYSKFNQFLFERDAQRAMWLVQNTQQTYVNPLIWSNNFTRLQILALIEHVLRNCRLVFDVTNKMYLQLFIFWFIQQNCVAMKIWSYEEPAKKHCCAMEIQNFADS